MDQISNDLKRKSLKYAIGVIIILVTLIVVISLYHKQSTTFIDNRSSDPKNTQEKIIFDNIKIKINNDVFSYDQIYNEVQETSLISYFNKNIKKGDTVIYVSQDVGVQQLLIAKLLSQSGRIYVLNPFEKYNNTIELSAEANNFKSRILTKTFAISDYSGEGMLVYKNDKSPEYGLIQPKDHVLEKGYNALNVTITSLDTLYPNLQNINLLRISSKRGAINVINGAKQIIKRSPNIKIILDYIKDESISISDLNKLQQSGFEIFEITENGSVSPVNISNITREHIILQKRADSYSQKVERTDIVPEKAM